MFRKFLALIVLTSAFSSSIYAADGTINTYNLIIKNDVKTTNEIGGMSFIGGNLTGGTFQMGFDLPQDPNVDAVTVVGNINTGDLHVENGHNLVYGGNVQGSTKIINNGGGSNIKGNQTLLQSEFEKLYAQVIAESEYYSNLTQTGSYTYTENKIIKLNASTTGLSVITIDAGLLNNSNGEISFSEIPTYPVIINVVGSENITIRAKAVGNLAGDDLASLVAWNFNDATRISLEGDGWVGSILAPYADIYAGNNGHIEGAVAALSYDGNIELHNSLFNYPPVTQPEPDSSTSVPEPSSLILLALGLLAILRSKRVKS